MFFFIGGMQPKTVHLGQEARTCPVCGQAQVFTRRIDHYISLFFIPLLRVKTGEPFSFCEHCRAPLGGFPVDAQDSGSLPFKKCRHCGKSLGEDFSYCPYCGQRF